MTDYQSKYNIIDEKPPHNVPLKAQYKRGFAYYTMRERLPVILTQVIDQLSKDKEQIVNHFGEEAREELKHAIGEISKLKYELQTDKELNPIVSQLGDEKLWNDFIDSLGEQNSFYSACWLYTETYMYRRLNSIFENTSALKKLDYFQQQKHKALTNSYEAMGAVLQSIENFNQDAGNKDETEVGEFFRKMLKLNLWGNRCDLSITAGQDVKQDGDPFSLLAALDECIVSDHTVPVWECVKDLTHSGGHIVVDIINDNSGYELFTDLCLADFMIEHRLAQRINFNVKAIPWYISDVTPKDMQWTLDTLGDHENPLLSAFGKRLKSRFLSGELVLKEVHNFWTSPYEFCRMQDVCPALYEELSRSQLLIFKGDLNYRKLLGDFNFPYTTPFRDALRGFVPTSLCTLRTVKADLICGLQEGLSDKLDAKDDQWMVTGEYGVIQFVRK
ncbi:damage-control phosphatase ARMT1-like [Uranotaenia lowii]|uniref:damage-control phosphatase ARMT1-like n=1 Tax=Uranotaenia lowii TaxID=190385 RepID=UPI0024786E50|nr:damage-control phosphatase ARMT1-like [Uranotaenia lowii]XP_055598646.1 damage-control phosphatase ARMT1-like [Uranotaenia lowii]XP_055598647.1 damage-control phosphatase ARMT1-like [Uranotaenia lowii]